MNVAIKYYESLAHYEVKRDKPGIYNASLVFYEGDPKKSPPAALTLVRGIRRWTGSHENEIFLNELGNQIGDALRGE